MNAIPGRFYVTGQAQGPALVLHEPLSFWGGVDAGTGRIIDRSHPEHGQSVSGHILVMPSGRGSSSSSSVLAETLRTGRGPLAIIMARADPIITVGAIVVQSLYGTTCPVVVCDIEGVRSGMVLSIRTIEGGAALLEVCGGG